MKQILTSHEIGVFPTDTIYGIIGSAFSEDAVERIYEWRHRDRKKPMISLISSFADLKKFGVYPSPRIKKVLKRWWPGKVSVILPISHVGGGKFLTKFSYLHCGTGTLAFRLPAIDSVAGIALHKLLRQIGPVIAPSANLEGEPPAKTIREAKKYFGDRVGFYFNVGRLDSAPSTLVKVERDGKIVILRAGAVEIK